MRRHLSRFNRRRIAVAIEGLWIATVLGMPLAVHADCVAGGPGTFSCTDSSDISGTQTGETTLDATANPAVLNLTTGSVVENDAASVTTGAHSTLLTTGGSAVTVNNSGSPVVFDPNTGDMLGAGIYMNRGGVGFDPSGWGNDAAGNLLNGGVPAGVAAGLYASSGSGPLIYNGLFGSLLVRGEFSAGIFGNASRQEINLIGDASGNHASMLQNGDFSSTTGDTLTEGHWAIANYAGATFTAPAVLDGTQYATNVSAGQTTLRVGVYGQVIGDILMVDRNPLYIAAERLNPGLALAYSASEVGPRDSVIELSGDELSHGGGNVNGNLYFGSGAHTLTNHFGNLTGNIYVDQRDTAVVDVVGGVATPQYLVSGSKHFSFVNDGNWYGNLEINDTVGSSNTVSIYGDSYNNFVALNGVGNNTLNFYCGVSVGHPSCNTSTDISGFTTVNLFGEGTSAYLMSNGGGIHVLGNINVFNTHFAPRETLNAANLNISSDSSLIVEQPQDINANLNASGTVRLNDQPLHVTGNVTLGAGSVLQTTITGTGHGNVVVDGIGMIAADATVVPTISNTVVRTGDSYTLATNTSGTPQVANRGLIRWLLSDVGGNLVLTANANAAITLPGLSVGAANAIDALTAYSGTDPAFLALVTQLQNASTADVVHAAERLRPEINDGAYRLSLGVADKALGIVESHLFDAQLAEIGGMTGVSSGGEKSIGAGIWVQGFGMGGDQSRRAGVDGYTSSATGLTFGADRLVERSDRLRLGAAFSYARGDVGNQGITVNNRITLNHYLATIYAAWSDTDWYLNGMVGLGRQQYQTERAPMPGMNNHGSHSGVQLTGRVEAGLPIRFDDALTFVPVASVSYNRLHEEGYQEHGSLTALSVGGRDASSLRAGLGGKAIYAVQEEDWRADLELRAMWRRELADPRQDVTARFLAGGPSFVSPGVDLARDDFIVGGSVRLTGANEQDEVSLLLSYDADFRSQYFGQALSMMLRYDFDQGSAYARQAEFRKAAAQTRATIPVKVREQDIAILGEAIAPGAVGNAAENAVAATLEAWAKARANQEVDQYLRHYAADFTSEDATNHNAWERKRKAQLSREGRMAVNIAYLKIRAAGDEASAVFTQTVSGPGKKEVSRKVLDLVAKDGRWLIAAENDLPVTE